MILNPCVISNNMVDEKECKACTKDCRYAGQSTTEERLNTASYGLDSPRESYVPNEDKKEVQY